MNIDELMERIKNGDEEAFEELLSSHHSMIYKIIYTLNLEVGDYQIDIDSLYQEGSIALYKAVFSYEKDKEMSFSSYAYMVIRGRLHTYIRDLYKSYNKNCLSLDDPEGLNYELFRKNEYVCQNPVSYHREQEFQRYLNDFVNTLSKEDKELFKLRSEDFTYKQISERLNVKTKRIDNRLRALRRRLKEYLDEEEE